MTKTSDTGIFEEPGGAGRARSSFHGSRGENITDGESTSLDGLGGLLNRLVNDFQAFVELRIQLLKREFGDTVKAYAKDSAFIAVGACFLFFALIFLDLTAMFLLARLMPFTDPINYACGAAIVMVLNGFAGGGLVYVAVKDFGRHSPLPEKSLDEIGRDKEWVSNQLG